MTSKIMDFAPGRVSGRITAQLTSYSHPHQHSHLCHPPTLPLASPPTCVPTHYPVLLDPHTLRPAPALLTDPAQIPNTCRCPCARHLMCTSGMVTTFSGHLSTIALVAHIATSRSDSARLNFVFFAQFYHYCWQCGNVAASTFMVSRLFLVQFSSVHG